MILVFKNADYSANNVGKVELTKWEEVTSGTLVNGASNILTDVASGETVKIVVSDPNGACVIKNITNWYFALYFNDGSTNKVVLDGDIRTLLPFPIEKEVVLTYNLKKIAASCDETLYGSNGLVYTLYKKVSIL